MYKINFDDEKVLLNYLKDFETKHKKRQKILNEILEISDEDDEKLSYWEFTDNLMYGQLFSNKYAKDTQISSISHILESVIKINGEYFGHIKVLTTNCGKILDGLIKQGSILYLEPVYYSIYIDKKIIRLDIK